MALNFISVFIILTFRQTSLDYASQILSFLKLLPAIEEETTYISNLSHLRFIINVHFLTIYKI